MGTYLQFPSRPSAEWREDMERARRRAEAHMARKRRQRERRGQVVTALLMGAAFGVAAIASWWLL